MSAQSRKGEDHFDLCLTSGLGMSQNKIMKETKCEIRVTETVESWTARALAPLCSYFAKLNTRYRLLLVIVLT